MTAVTNAMYCGYFFAPDPSKPGWLKCTICSTQRKDPSSGCTNLVSHLCTGHPTYKEIYAVEKALPDGRNIATYF